MVSRGASVVGDRWLAEAYAAHGRELYRFALRSLGDGGLAEEAVQDTFLRAWRAAERYVESLGSLRTWLFAIVRNVIIDVSRARAVRPQVDRNGVDVGVEPITDSEFDRTLV